MTDELLAAQTRHVAVGHDEVVGQRRTFGCSQSGFAVPNSNDFVTRLTECADQQLSDSGFVIHDQDTRGAGGHVSRPRQVDAEILLRLRQLG